MWRLECGVCLTGDGRSDEADWAAPGVRAGVGGGL